MKYKVIIEKEIEDWWGLEDVFDDPNIKDPDLFAVEILMEDISALLDNANFKIIRQESFAQSIKK